MSEIETGFWLITIMSVLLCLGFAAWGLTGLILKIIDKP